MKTSSIAVVLSALAAFTSASPVLTERQTLVCGGQSPQCCSVDVLGVLSIDCEIVPLDPDTGAPPATTQDFIDTCATIGKSAGCCLIGPLLELGVLCQQQ